MAPRVGASLDTGSDFRKYGGQFPRLGGCLGWVAGGWLAGWISWAGWLAWLAGWLADFSMNYMRIFFYENKVAVQNHNFMILAKFFFTLAPVRCRWNEIGYPRGF